MIARSAVVDHIEPVGLGGRSLDIENLVTACNPCNAIKADFTLDQLGWELLPIAGGDWDGLTGFYPALWNAAGQPNPAYHQGWMIDLGVSGTDESRP